MTALGIAMVVLTLCVIQALSQGLDATLNSTGNPDDLVILRPGANTETQSSVTREAFRVISSMPEVAMDSEGKPLCVAERYLTVYLPREGSKSRTNLALRGTSERALALRPSVRIAGGRFFRPGLNEVIVGRAAQRRFPQLQMHQTVHFEKRDWKIVGVFDADAQAYESELWGDLEDVGNAFQRGEFSSAHVKARSAGEAETLRKKIEDNPQLKLKATPETRYFVDQFETGLPLAIIGSIITALLAVGATFGAINTMYASVAARTREIAVLRAIGFGRWSVLGAFLLESVLLALVGGIAGCLLSIPFNGLQTGTMSWWSFTEMAFKFRVTPEVLGNGLIFAVLLGFVGGLFPALRASRMTITQALRAV